MSWYAKANNAETTVAQAYTAGSGSLTVADGSKFPTEFPFRLSCFRSRVPLSILSVTNRAGNVLTIGGAIEGTTDVDLNINDVVGNYSTSGDFQGLEAAVDGKAPLVHTHTIPDVDGLQTALGGKIPTSEKGAANGVASLGSDSKHVTSQINDKLIACGDLGRVILWDTGTGSGPPGNAPSGQSWVHFGSSYLRTPEGFQQQSQSISALVADVGISSVDIEGTIGLFPGGSNPQSGLATLMNGSSYIYIQVRPAVFALRIVHGGNTTVASVNFSPQRSTPDRFRVRMSTRVYSSAIVIRVFIENQRIDYTISDPNLYDVFSTATHHGIAGWRPEHRVSDIVIRRVE